MDRELLDVAEEIESLLRDGGYPDKADWIQKRLAVLRDLTATPDSHEFVRMELHRIVPGMGGLVDTVLRTAAPGMTPVEADQRLSSLADRLFKLTEM